MRSLFEAGIQPNVVQSIAGRRHYSTAIDINTHMSEDEYQKADGGTGFAFLDTITIYHYNQQKKNQ